MRRTLLTGIVAMTLSLSACSDDKPSLPEEKKTSAADKTAADEKALTKLATDLWKARTESQNNGNTSRAQFAGLLAPGLAEVELGILQRYKDSKLLRTGVPKITAIETTASGETGEILLCLNEDTWGAEVDGEPAEVAKYGLRPWGAKAERTPDGWIVTEELKPETLKDERKKSC